MAGRHIVHVKDVFSDTAAPLATSCVTTNDVVGDRSCRLSLCKKRRAPASPTNTELSDQLNRCDVMQQPTTAHMLLSTTADVQPTKLTDYFTCGNASCLCTVLSGERHYCDTDTLRARSAAAYKEEIEKVSLPENDKHYAISKVDDGNLTAISNTSHSGSSSGYQSEVGHVVNDTQPALDRRQAPLSEDDEEDECFAEEECTIDLDEEDAESRYTTLYREYHGEDFSRYLLDDSDVFAPQTLSTWITNPPNVQRRTAGADRTMKNTIKHRLSKMFTISRSHRNANVRANENTIYDISYRDTKLARDEVCDHKTSGSNMGHDDHWWAGKTSTKSLASNDDTSVISRTSSAYSARDNSEHGAAMNNAHPNGKTSMYDSDIESNRTTLRRNARGAKQNINKKSTVWSRFRNSLRRLERPKYDSDSDDDGGYYYSGDGHCASVAGTEKTTDSQNTQL